jgi:hypothetical protein
MNISISGGRYAVREPQGRRYFVSKSRLCTCGRDKCVHVRAVALYLEMGGYKAVDNHELSIGQRVERIRAAQRKFWENTGLANQATLAILMAYRVHNNTERLEWIETYSHNSQKPINNQSEGV